MDAIELPTQRISREPNGMVRITIRDGAEIGLDDAKSAVSAMAPLCGHKPCPVLVDLRWLKSVTRDARQYYAGPETAKLESAVALLISSPIGRAMGNFFLGLNKPSYPTRLFVSEPEALEWLSGFLE